MIFLEKRWTLEYLMLVIFLVSDARQHFHLRFWDGSTEHGNGRVTPTSNNLAHVLDNTTSNNFAPFPYNTTGYQNVDQLSMNSSASFQRFDLSLSRGLNRNSHTDLWKSLSTKFPATSDHSWNMYESSARKDEQNRSEKTYEISETYCVTQKVITFSGQAGVIHGFFNRKTEINCTLRIKVPEKKYVEVRLDYSREQVAISLEAIIFPNVQNFKTHVSRSFLINFPLFLSASNQILVQARRHWENTEFKLRFTTNEEDLRRTLPLVRTSPNSGYVTTWDFDENGTYPCLMNASRTVHVPPNHVVMVSFSYVDIQSSQGSYHCSKTSIQLYEINSYENFSLKMEICYNSVIPALVLSHSIQIRFYAQTCFGRGFKMSFSFHTLNESPVKLDSGLWDCSGRHYGKFLQHLECNLEPECHGGEDEGSQCSFSSLACNDTVVVGNKCYVLFKSKGYSTWSSSSRECRNRGGNLANMKTKEERDAFNKIYHNEKLQWNMNVGLSTYDGTLPPQYKNVLSWSDATVAYDYTYLAYRIRKEISVNTRDIFCSILSPASDDFEMSMCFEPTYTGITLCEFSVTKPNVSKMSLQMISSVLNDHVTKTNNSLYVSCPDGHFTLDFLSCDKASHCGAQMSAMHCLTWKGSRKSVLTDMFVCRDHSNTLPYSLVCDFRPDCPDESDETFCKRDQHCDGFKCRNGQCIELSKLCNIDKDCWDASDEGCVVFQIWNITVVPFYAPPAVIDFSQQDDLIYKKLNSSDACPETHFRCPPDGYCLPIYVRCNGVYDCPYHEDEEDCVSYTCPGFYRCRASTVCVHVDHMCDGRPQCPQHDDELFCQLKCPQGCLCQGLAFVCPTTFDTQKFPAMRYLDASTSGMSTTELYPSIYLVWLSLAACNLQNLSNMSLPSLQTLDLSENLISWLDMSYFMQFEHLQVLRLTDNPLQSLFTSYTAFHSPLAHLDMSRTFLSALEGEMFSFFSNVKVLNLSFSLITAFSSEQFNYIHTLTELDIRGTDIKEIDRETLRHVTSLRTIHASYYTICCQEILPDVEDLLCLAPIDSFSSCQNLLRSKPLKVILWILCFTTIAGNICSAIYIILSEKGKLGWAFRFLMINLNFSDVLMGIYLFVIGVVDQVYTERYLWYEQSWTAGTLCKIVGVVFFISNEVSLMTLVLLAADCTLLSRFKNNHSQYTLITRICCCCFAWIIGLVLAAFPLFLMARQRDFYRQNSVCAPLPVHKDDFVGWPYEFAVCVVLNPLLAVTADIFYFFSLKKTSSGNLRPDDHPEIVEGTATRRLTLLLVTKTLSCSLMSFLGVTTHMGTSYSLEVISGVALLVCPLNISMNPVLYAVSVHREARRKRRRLRLLKVLESRRMNMQKTRIFSIQKQHP